MKTKTTLAALLLTAVMVTPGYGAEDVFLAGAQELTQYRQGNEVKSWFSISTFSAYVKAIWHANVIATPNNVSFGEVADVVATYVKEHPAEHNENEIELIKRAVKKEWPKENLHLEITKAASKSPNKGMSALADWMKAQGIGSTSDDVSTKPQSHAPAPSVPHSPTTRLGQIRAEHERSGKGYTAGLPATPVRGFHSSGTK